MPPTRVDLRHLRPTLEFAVRFAEEGQKARPPVRYPAPLKRYFRSRRLGSNALPAVQRAVDGDDEFRAALADAATVELVGEIGMAWLVRDEGWEDEVVSSVAAVEAAETDTGLRGELRRSEKRRDAAERATARAMADLAALQARLDERQTELDARDADVERMRADIASLRNQLIEARNRTRHADDRTAAAERRASAAELARTDAERALDEAGRVRDATLADRASSNAMLNELADVAAQAASVAARLAALGGDERRNDEREPRRPLGMPGGVLGSSDEATAYLLGSGASILVDGYNVAKLGWPDLELADQRRVLIDHLENLARRRAADVTAVFDGDDITGATADGRRLIRVVYSPRGTIADDVVRDEVDRLPSSRQVVVVTNDREVLTDVRSKGANVLSSHQLLREFTR